MKRIAVLSIALAAIAMVSCKREEIGDNTLVKKTFSASLDQTKAYVDGTLVKWSENDKVAIYDSKSDDAHKFTVTSGGSTTATISGEVCQGSSRTYTAVSPYTAAKGLSEGNVTVTVPSEQTAGTNKIDESALVMVAKTSNDNLQFHNVNGVFEINVDVDNVNKITIRSNDGTAIAGSAVVNPVTGEVVSTSETVPEVILKPGNGQTFFAQGYYYIAALPVLTTNNGITVNAYTTGNKVYAKKSDKSLLLKRNAKVSLGGMSKITPKDLLPASIAEQTSSTLTFNLGSTDLVGAHRLALYEDAACTKLVVAHNIPADKIRVTDPTHRFVFGGLTQDTVYYFQITDEAGVPSAVVQGKTEPFTNVAVPEVAAAGDIVLAEDFGEIAIHGAYNSITAAGWAPFSDAAYVQDFRFTVPSGELNEYYFGHGDESRLFCALRDAVSTSRLADWAEWMEQWDAANYGIVCPHSGHLKIGANSVIGRIVTPEMKFVPAGKTATVEVTFTGARLDADSPVVQVVTGSKVQVGSDNRIDPYNFVLSGVLDEKPVTVNKDGWGKYTVTVSNVTADSRIAIGTKRGTDAGNQRFIISDVTVKLVSFETPAPWSGWTDITASYAAENHVAFGSNIKMYKNTNLYGRAGNVGYVFKVPAGQLDMKIAEKWNSLGDNQRKISQTLNVMKEYTIFIPYQAPGVWGNIGDGNTKYFSPLIYGPNRSGNTIFLRGNTGFNDGVNGTPFYEAFAPALGVREGKAYIENAGKRNDKLYIYSDITPSGEAEWNVEACAHGMFQIVKDGKSLIAGSDDASLNAYNQAWRKYPNMTQKLTSLGSSMLHYDKLRTGRVVIGCTAAGDLIIFVVEKFVNGLNQGQYTDAGQNGADTDNRGLTMYETAKVMADLGCSDAMTIDDLNWSFVVLQDGTARGKDLFWNNQRWNTNGTMKDANNEFENLWTLCIKANNNVGDLNRNPVNW